MNKTSPRFEQEYRAVHITPKSLFLAEDYWASLKLDGLASSAFPEKDIQSMQQFVGMVNDGYNVLFVVLDKDLKPCAHVNLNAFRGLSAQIHFSILKKYHGPMALVMAKTVVRQFFEMTRGENKDFVRTLIGVTPARNKLACKFIQRVGFKKIGTLQGAVNIEDKFEDAMLSILQKGEI